MQNLYLPSDLGLYIARNASWLNTCFYPVEDLSLNVGQVFIVSCKEISSGIREFNLHCLMGLIFSLPSFNCIQGFADKYKRLPNAEDIIIVNYKYLPKIISTLDRYYISCEITGITLLAANLEQTYAKLVG